MERKITTSRGTRVQAGPEGFRLPAEWEPHEATWLAWPHEKSDWPGKFAPIPWIYAQIIRHLARVEKVRILIENPAAEQRVSRMLRDADVHGTVEFFHHPTNRSWTRDYCPIFVKSKSGEVAITEWKFNGWAKYDNSAADASTPDMIAKRLRMKKFSTGRVLEGGSIDTNGRGILLTTEECLLDEHVQTRNPGLSRRDYEQLFREYP
jgi:agmatine deiminase